jgi:hypothetical protein
MNLEINPFRHSPDTFESVLEATIFAATYLLWYACINV